MKLLRKKINYNIVIWKNFVYVQKILNKNLINDTHACGLNRLSLKKISRA